MVLGLPKCRDPLQLRVCSPKSSAALASNLATWTPPRSNPAMPAAGSLWAAETSDGISGMSYSFVKSRRDALRSILDRWFSSADFGLRPVWLLLSSEATVSFFSSSLSSSFAKLNVSVLFSHCPSMVTLKPPLPFHVISYLLKQKQFLSLGEFLTPSPVHTDVYCAFPLPTADSSTDHRWGPSFRLSS